MKIGVDIRCLMEAQYSGISEYTYNLLNHLLKIDQENQYFLFYNVGKRGREVPKFKFPNVTYKKFTYPNRLFNLSLRFLKIKKIDKMLGGVDIFLMPSFLFTNLSKDCKKVLIVHDLSFELYPEFFDFKKRLWHKLINPKKLCQDADKVIAISENTKNDIINVYNVDEKKIKVIYNGVNEIFFQPITKEAKQKVKDKYKLDDNYIFFLGNLEPRKNVETLIQAFDGINDKTIKLVIAGGQAWKYDNIYKLWQNSTAKNRIKFLGYVDADERPALYSLAKMFVYPSIYEGFGLPPLEAMACSTPVITSFNSSLVEAVGEGGLLVDQNNINELSQTINNLLSDEKLQELLIKKGRDQAELFRWEKTSQGILEVLKSFK